MEFSSTIPQRHGVANRSSLNTGRMAPLHSHQQRPHRRHPKIRSANDNTPSQFLHTPIYRNPAHDNHADRSYDYEKKYGPDPKEEELNPAARCWKVYLDEAESYDEDMLRGFRETIDSLLVFAALFSAVVTTFVVDTSESFKPDYSRIAVSLLFEQVELLRAVGNTTLIATVESHSNLDQIIYSTMDVWINGLFYTSLAFSLSTALLCVLIKQWLQAYSSITSGDARQRALTRHFRFSGFEEGKVPEIISLLPLLLHISLWMFCAGLSLLVFTLQSTIASVISVITGTAFLLYTTSGILPSIWIQCPYRVPAFHYGIQSLALLWDRLRFYYAYLRDMSRRWSGSLGDHCGPSTITTPSPTFVIKSFQALEQEVLQETVPHKNTFLSDTMTNALSWLFTISSNISVRRIILPSMERIISDPVVTPSAIPFLDMVAFALDTIQPNIDTDIIDSSESDIFASFIRSIAHRWGSPFSNPDSNLSLLLPPNILERSVIEGKLSLIQVLLDPLLFQQRIISTSSDTMSPPSTFLSPALRTAICMPSRNVIFERLFTFSRSCDNWIGDDGWVYRERDENGDTFLHNAVAASNAFAVDLIMSSIPSLDKLKYIEVLNNRWHTPLHQAVRVGLKDVKISCRIVASLLEKGGANVDALDEEYQTPLHHVIRTAGPGARSTQMIELLLARGGTVGDALGFKDVATMKLHFSLFKHPLQEAPHEDDDDDDPRNTQEQKYYNSGYTPLHLATILRKEFIVKFLLTKGANPNATTFEGNTALHFASFQKSHGIVRLLVQFEGTDACVANDAGLTPLHVACLSAPGISQSRLITTSSSTGKLEDDDQRDGWNTEETIKLLVSQGADVNAVDKVGRTPLDVILEDGRWHPSARDIIWTTIRDHGGRVVMGLLTNIERKWRVGLLEAKDEWIPTPIGRYPTGVTGPRHHDNAPEGGTIPNHPRGTNFLSMS